MVTRTRRAERRKRSTFMSIMRSFIWTFSNFRFCPSVFIYLMCVVPTMWFLELHELDKRLNDAMEQGNETNWFYTPKNESKEDLHANLGTVLGVKQLLSYL